MTIKKVIGLILVVVAWLVIFDNTSALANSNNFYGTESLKPMVKENETTIYLPGGVKIKTESDETKYTLTDHLQSIRLAVAGDNFVSMRADYTPFGDTPTDTITETANQYTGMTYEPETATHDYHARSYDGSTARFGSPDTIRESISPYSYTENNPINFVDPDGLGRVSLYLYSMYGVDVPDFRGYTSLRRKTREIEDKIETAPYLEKVSVSKLEDQNKIQTRLPEDRITHLILTLHGNPNVVDVYDPDSKQKIPKGPRDFAVYLRDRLHYKYEGSDDTLESIFFDSCEVGRCGGESKDSFADEFVKVAKDIFPNLREVIASPYETIIGLSPQDKLRMSIVLEQKGGQRVSFEMNRDKFLRGKLKRQDRLFIPPSADTIDARGYRLELHPKKYDWDYSPAEKKRFFKDLPDFKERKPNFFTEPAFRKLEIVRPRTKTPSVDITSI